LPALRHIAYKIAIDFESTMNEVRFFLVCRNRFDTLGNTSLFTTREMPFSAASNKKSKKIVKEGIGGIPADERESPQNAGRRKIGWKSPRSSFTSLRPHGRWRESILLHIKKPAKRGTCQ